ncbi:MAG: hypothetical protein ACFE8L_06775 [Candidatus Hodarchaeota archaeon]
MKGAKQIMELKCIKCGNILETLPQHCGQDMIFNEETGALECYMGEACGYIDLDNFICENCCK